MTKMTEGQKIKPDSDIPRPQDDSVGALLRATRLAKNLSIEEASAALRIRHVQLRAIEENNLEELPGITYAAGFVRSYANYLGLNGADVVNKFKIEHGYASSQSKLSFPEPVSEGRVPDTLMLGAGFFLALLVLVFWAVYSNMSGGSGEEAAQIPEAPAAAAMTDAARGMPPEQTDASSPAPAAAAAPAPAPATTPAAIPETVAPALPENVDASPKKTAGEDVPGAAEAPVENVSKEHSSIMWSDTPPEDEETVIKIQRGKSRVALQASESSWVQITDADGEVIYKKVLKPGEQYNVPDQKGLSLVTSNAGGLEITLDGKEIQPIGEQGEIVRGISLDPAELKKLKLKAGE